MVEHNKRASHAPGRTQGWLATARRLIGSMFSGADSARAMPEKMPSKKPEFLYHRLAAVNASTSEDSQTGSRDVVENYVNAAPDLFGMQDQMAGTSYPDSMPGSVETQGKFTEDFSGIWFKAGRQENFRTERPAQDRGASSARTKTVPSHEQDGDLSRHERAVASARIVVLADRALGRKTDPRITELSGLGETKS